MFNQVMSDFTSDDDNNSQPLSKTEKLLFASQEELAKACSLVDLPTIYSIDCSGSTAGAIMSSQKTSAKRIAAHMKPLVVLQWGTYCEQVATIDSIKSSGGTSPYCMVPFLKKHEFGTLVLYTDGQVGVSDMELFRNQLKEAKGKTPAAIVVLTLRSFFAHGVRKISDLKHQVNASIPEACLTIADHCIVLLNIMNTHRILMGSGDFAKKFPMPELSEELPLSELPLFDVDGDDFASISVQSLPSGCLLLPSFEAPLKTSALYALPRVLSIADCAEMLNDDHQLAVISKVVSGLFQRAYLPKLDLDAARKTLVFLQKACLQDKRTIRLAELRAELAQIGASSESGSDKHRALLSEFQTLSKKKPSSSSSTTSTNDDKDDGQASISQLRQFIHTALSNIVAYESDKTSLTLGSNRANRAKTITNDELAEIGDCIQIEECPIFLQKGDACILLKAPTRSFEDIQRNIQNLASASLKPTNNDNNDDDNMDKKSQSSSNVEQETELIVPTYEGQDLAPYSTSDFFMENPFCFGTFLSSALTPGVYCYDFGCEAKRNPMTREVILGAVPLSKDPLILLRHLANLFTARKELWHLVRGYVSMVAHHLKTVNWAKEGEEANLLKAHVEEILQNYPTNDNLKGETETSKKVPLRDAIKNVLTNIELLRDRTPDDINAITEIADVFLPDFKYDKTAVLALAQFMGTFQSLLAKHKLNESMFEIMFDVDAFGHFKAMRKDTAALIARLFYLHNNSHLYRGRKLQDALDQAMLDPVVGDFIRSTLKHGFPPKEAFEFMDIMDEPDAEKNPHFGPETCGEWTKEGRPSGICVYCGFTSDEGEVMTRHFVDNFGAYFFPGLRAVNLAFAHFRALKQQPNRGELYTFALNVLKRRLGELNPLLHTQYVKKRLLFFIDKLMVLNDNSA